MEWLHEFHFLRPLWLALLFLPLFLGWHIYRNERVQSSWADVCDENLLNFLLIKGDNRQRRFSYVLAVLFMIFAILALAGPTWIKKPNPALSVDNPVMIVLNLSSDMEQNDVAPSRLVRARYIIKDFIQTLRSTEIGLEVYSDEPFMISPLTEDTALIDNLLPVIERNIMPANGDRLDRAIDMAVERMQKVGYTAGNVIVVAADVGERFDAAMESAEKAHRKGFDVNVIKVSAAENEKLQMVAQKGHGVYLNYNQDYGNLTRKINDLYAKELNESQNMQSIWVDAGYYLFWLPALLLLYYYRRGVVLGLLLCLFCSEAYAGWFLNDNQEAMRYFKRQQYDKAAQMFQDSGWRGAAAYKSGDYKAAYEEFSKQDDVTALYNQGNALAKSGKIDEAIAKYEEVLKQQPDFEDARFNLEYLKKMQQNQNQQQNQQQDNQQEQNQQQNSGGEDQDKNNQQQNQEQEGSQDQQQEKQEQQNQEQQQQNAQNQEQQQSGTENQNQDDKGQQNQEQQEQNQEQQSQDKQNQEQQSQDKQNQEQQSQDKQNQEQQEQNQSQSSSDERRNSENTSDEPQSSQGDDKQPQDQSNQAQNDKQDEAKNGADTPKSDSEKSEGQEREAEAQVQSGQPDENGKEAEEISVQNGDKPNEDKEKIRAQLQKFRDVPEDKGGLLRALIAKEYRKNRYKDE